MVERWTEKKATKQPNNKEIALQNECKKKIPIMRFKCCSLSCDEASMKQQKHGDRFECHQCGRRTFEHLKS